MVYLTSSGVAASTANLFISTSNNVGIGTTSPVYIFQVNAGSASSTGQVCIENPTNTNNGYGTQLVFGMYNPSTSQRFAQGAIGSIRENNAANYASSLGLYSFDNSNLKECMRLTSGGNVGIGTSSPGSKFDVYTSGHGIRQTDSGGGAQVEFYTNTTAGWVGTFNNYPLYFFTNNANEQMVLTTAGRVGIGTSSPNGGLHVRTTTQTSLYTEQYSGVGNQGSGIQCWNTNIFSPVLDNQMSCGWSSNRWTTVFATTGTINTSDSRQKMNISPSNLGLNFISNLNPVSYAWIDGGTPATEPNVVGARPGKRTFYGFLAQDVKKTLDAMDTGDFAGWTLDDSKDPDSTQGLRYTEFIAPMVKAIQELSAKNTVLEQSLASATARLDSLEARLAAAGI
jgi:hypothetical protein